MTDKNARVNNFEEETWKQWRFLLPLTHIVIALVLIVSLFVQEPKEWHRSFFTSSLMQDISASLGTFYVIKDISIDAENFTDSTCATYGTEDLQAMIEWGGKENLQSHLRDICEFQKVENELLHESDPRGLHFLASASPKFLMVSLQIVVAATLLGTSTLLKQFFSTEKFKMPRHEVFLPIDQITAILILIAWPILAIVLQGRFYAVYNNILTLFVLAIYMSLNIVVWSWRKSKADQTNSYYDFYFKNAEPQTKGAGQDPFQAQKNMYAIKIHNMMRAPLIPYDSQDSNDKRMLLHTLHDVSKALWDHKLLPIPRFILAASIFPLSMTAAMYQMGSFWLYSDIFYFTLWMFLTTTCCIPLYVVCRLSSYSVVVASKEPTTMSKNDDLDVERLNWYVTACHLLLTHLLTLAYTVYYFFSLFFVTPITEIQRDVSVTNCVIVFGAFALFNLVVYLACFYMMMSKPSEPKYENFLKTFMKLVEVLVAVCITLPLVLCYYVN